MIQGCHLRNQVRFPGFNGAAVTAKLHFSGRPELRFYLGSVECAYHSYTLEAFTAQQCEDPVLGL